MFSAMRQVLTRASVIGVAATALAGCDCDCDDHYYDNGGDYYGTCSDAIRESRIDADQALEVTPGEGVGVFVEYSSGGRWHVYVTCDTARSGYACNYDVTVQPVGPSQIIQVSPDALENSDTASLIGGDFAKLVAQTDYDFDGYYIDLEPGVALNVEAYLDNSCTNYLYWFGDGGVHSSAPSMPINLVPSEE